MEGGRGDLDGKNERTTRPEAHASFHPSSSNDPCQYNMYLYHIYLIISFTAGVTTAKL